MELSQLGPHLHLALNHFPVITMPLVFILVAIAYFLKFELLKKISLGLVVLSSLFVVPAYLTGEFAEEGLKIFRETPEGFIEKHEEMAEAVIWLVAITGVSAGIGLLISIWKRSTPTWIMIIICLMTFLSTLVLACTANLGGQISHPEIRSNSKLDLTL